MSIVDTQNRQLIEIYDAIMGNSPSLLESVLETIDPALVQPAILFRWSEYEMEDDEEHDDYIARTGITKFTFGAAHEDRTTIVSLLHIAVYNCYKNKGFTSSGNARTSLQILDILLKFHLKYADNKNWSRPYHISHDTLIFNVPGFYYASYSNLYPKHFAAKLKAMQDSDTLGVCIDKLIKYENDLKAIMLAKKEVISSTAIDMQSVPKPVFNTWKSLLFSEKYADVVFEVTDETVTPPTITNLYGHRCIITTSSQYFDAMLSGNWLESHGNQAIIKVNEI